MGLEIIRETLVLLVMSTDMQYFPTSQCCVRKLNGSSLNYTSRSSEGNRGFMKEKCDLANTSDNDVYWFGGARFKGPT